MLEGTVESLAFGGSGIMHADGKVVFIPFSAPQDHLQVEITKNKKRYAEGKITKIISSGPERASPLCPYYTRCGGCQFQHLTYEAQLLAKRKFVHDALERLAGISLDLPPVVPSSPWGYREHIRLNLRISGSGFEAGYLGEGFVPVKECAIFQDPKRPLLPEVQKQLQGLLSDGVKEGSLRIFKREGTPLLAFSFFPYLPKNSSAIFSDSPYAVVMQSPRQKISFGEVECSLSLEGLFLSYSPYSFLQNNLPQSADLYRTILRQMQTKRVADLYCGIGISSLLLAKSGVSVTGVETNQTAIEFAKKNAEQNGISGTSFFSAAVENFPLEDLSPQGVLVNPPRTGLTPKALQKILNSRPEEILYVSCMPPTLARDLKEFLSTGYCLTHVQAFDMFPQTTHVETLVRLERKKA